MRRIFWGIISIAVALIAVGLICSFVGIGWADVDSFLGNGFPRAIRFLGLFRGIAG